MRMFRSLLGLMCLCLFLGASVASAAEGPSAHASREADRLAHIVGQFRTFLKAVWENDAGHIDPFGKSSPNAGTPTGDGSATASADYAGCIDPFGGCRK